MTDLMMMIMIEVMYDDEVTFTVARRLSPWNTACIQAFKDRAALPTCVDCLKTELSVELLLFLIDVY